MQNLKRRFRNLIKKVVGGLGLNRLLYAVKSIFASEKVYQTAEQARAELDEFSPYPQGSSIANNKIIDCEYDLQIIIPAYNVEKYIEDCVNSILEQKTKYTYKIILINDGSTDKTKEIIQQYLNNPRVEIIDQENRGFSGARNRGLEKIQAKYIAFVDSDDKMAPNAIENLLNAATANDADIIEGGFYRLEKELFLWYKHKKFKQVEALKGLKGYPCGKVFKSSLFENIHFPEGFWFEDSIGRFLIYPKALRSFVIPDIVYIYRNNLVSISHTAPLKKKSIDTYWVTELLVKEQQQLKIAISNEVFENFLKQVVLNYKRIKKMPIEIQKNVFVCAKELQDKYFPQQKSRRFKHLIKAFQNSDFGKYKCFCDLYF